MKRKALLMALSAKSKNNLLLLIDSFKFANIKTKEVAKMLSKLPVKAGSVLIVLPNLDKKAILSARNLPKVATIQARDLNALDLLSSKYLVMPKESIKIIKELFVKWYAFSRFI